MERIPIYIITLYRNMGVERDLFVAEGTDIMKNRACGRYHAKSLAQLAKIVVDAGWEIKRTNAMYKSEDKYDSRARINPHSVSPGECFIFHMSYLEQKKAADMGEGTRRDCIPAL